MITTWLVVKDTKIIRTFETGSKDSVLSSLSFLGIKDYDNIINTGIDKSFKKGRDIREFDQNFNERPVEELVNENIITIPEDSKLVDNNIVKKTIIEMYVDKTKELPEKYKLEQCEVTDNTPEGYKLVYKTMEEQLTDNDITIEEYKQCKINLILNTFENNLQNGHFISTILGIDVDCRRSITKNDKQNVEGLISNMTRNSKAFINYVGYTEIKQNVTIKQLQDLAYEMEDYVLGLYEKKWLKQDEINNASTIEEVINVNW